MLSARAHGYRKSRLTTVALGCTALIALGSITGTGGKSSDAVFAGASYRWKRGERCYMEKINNRRAKQGLNRLGRDKQLGYAARRHAKWLAREQGLWHDGNLHEDILYWRALGQNTGTGGRCRFLFRSFWQSSEHRRNIMDPTWRHVGVGVGWKNGRAYVQQVFQTRRNPDNRWHFP